MNTYVKAKNELIEIFILMIILQGSLFVMKTIGRNLFELTLFSEKMMTMIGMIILTAVLVLITHIKKIRIELFPKKFSKGYVIFTIISLILMLSTPSIYTEGFKALMVVIYGSIVTPIYEEYLFRGIIWRKLEKCFNNEKIIYIMSAILFSIWHIGYVIAPLLQGNLFALFSKMAVGLVYGLILGIVRMKTHNCYSTMLLHGILNVFSM